MTVTDDASPALTHGYTVADHDTLARKAASTSQWRIPYFAERQDLARFAIAEQQIAGIDRKRRDGLAQRAADTTVLASAEKIGAAPRFVVLPMTAVAGIITDAPADDDTLRRPVEGDVATVPA